MYRNKIKINVQINVQIKIKKSIERTKHKENRILFFVCLIRSLYLVADHALFLLSLALMSDKAPSVNDVLVAGLVELVEVTLFVAAASQEPFVVAEAIDQVSDK